MRSTISWILSAIVLITAVPAARGALGDHQWSRGWDATGLASADGTGYVAAAGTFFSTLDLGGGPFTPANVFGGDVFLARFDAAGNHVWSQQITPGGFGFMLDAVATAPDGSIYLAGTLQNGDIDFGGGTLTGSGDFVLAAFEPDGSHRWSVLVGAGRVQKLVASDTTVACTGYTYGSLDFGGGTLTSAGGADAFLGVLDADGTHRFSHAFGDAAGDQGGMGLALDPDDGVVLAASASSTIDFGGGALTATGTDLCLAAFDATGLHQWSWNRAGTFSSGSGILFTLDVAIDADGEIAVGGLFRFTTDLGGGTLTSAGQGDVFVARYDADGSHLASQTFGGSVTDGIQGISFDGGGNLAVAGTFLSTSIDFGGGPLMHSGGFGADWFLAVFDPSGSHLFSTAFTGNGQYLIVPRFHASGSLLLYGSGAGNTDFGGGPLSTTQFFLAQFEGESTSTGAPPRPQAAWLAQNHPNPFNPRTEIRFRLQEDSFVRLDVFDSAGRRVRALIDGVVSAGDHVIAFDGADDRGRALASGVYRYGLFGAGVNEVRSMVLVR